MRSRAASQFRRRGGAGCGLRLRRPATAAGASTAASCRRVSFVSCQFHACAPAPPCAAFCMAGARRRFAGPDLELAHRLLDEHFEARNHRLALLPRVPDQRRLQRVVDHVEDHVRRESRRRRNSR